ncbi:hypothetical protein [Candidatus Enterococcus courvalinii]|uniref:Uncharacterized protein n=1 Tax=Candidatus Enterococcus courvalinii TaxID=2815329 RepID=A0ABS3HX02_9ENTE|nr:hypothetical protein [Enterococcus sp. MSG2901]MBO0481007.1 hypothetical protein [Enterococcus sp. MSG2901]
MGIKQILADGIKEKSIGTSAQLVNELLGSEKTIAGAMNQVKECFSERTDE